MGEDYPQQVQWPVYETQIDPSFYKRFAGRTVTLGCWIKTNVVNNANLMIHDGTSFRSNYHTGSNEWEWIEHTIDVDISTTRFQILLECNGSTGDIAYFSQPMLVFGSSIGEGNYSKPMGEIIYPENKIRLETFPHQSRVHSTSDGLLNIEAETSGKIGKGIEAYTLTGRISDSASAGTSYVRVQFMSSLTSDNAMTITCGGLANDAKMVAQSWVKASSDGGLYYIITATGANTLSTDLFGICGLMLK